MQGRVADQGHGTTTNLEVRPHPRWQQPWHAERGAAVKCPTWTSPAARPGPVVVYGPILLLLLLLLASPRREPGRETALSALVKRRWPCSSLPHAVLPVVERGRKRAGVANWATVPCVASFRPSDPASITESAVSWIERDTCSGRRVKAATKEQCIDCCREGLEDNALS